MARRKNVAPARDWMFPDLSLSDNQEQSSLLDVLDNVLNKGIVLNGDIVLGVANVDLVYAKLSALLAAVDRIIDEPVFRPVAAGPRRRPRAGRRAVTRRQRSKR